MATVIKLKRGTSTPTTSDIVSGEVAVDTSAKQFYINDSGTIKEIGGGTGSGGGATVLGGDVRNYTGDGSDTTFTVSSGSDIDNLLVFLNGVYQRPSDYSVSGTTLTFDTAPISGDIITIKEIIESTAVDLTSISTDLTPDTHNAYDVGQLGSAFRDMTFVRKLQKNVQIFTRAAGLGSVATSLGFNINTSVANMTEVYTASGGLESPVLGGDVAAFDDSNPAFLFQEI